MAKEQKIVKLRRNKNYGKVPDIEGHPALITDNLSPWDPKCRVGVPEFATSASPFTSASGEEPSKPERPRLGSPDRMV